MRASPFFAVSCACAASLAAAASGCNFPSFAPDSVVSTVRILAVRADKPYAKPGDTVNLDILAVDGRADKPRPMGIFWVPVGCTNPRNGAYTKCYEEFAKYLQPGVDLTPVLHAGNSLSVTVPPDALDGGKTQPMRQYGEMIVFQMACAGHVQYLGAAAGPEPDAVPFGCFDETGKRLGTDDFVFSFASVFVFESLTNQNPTIDGLTFDSAPVDASAGITAPHCTVKDAKRCPTTAVDAVVPESSQEVDPIATLAAAATATGTTGTGTGSGTGTASVVKERVWVDYYVTQGIVRGGARQIYDPTDGKVTNTAAAFVAPQAAGEGVLFAVVRDNRGGVGWLQVPLHVQ
jgi:hypothetical protein